MLLRPAAVGVAAWALLVAVAVWWGMHALADNAAIGAPPVVGRWSWQPGCGLLAPALVGAAVVVLGPVLAARLPWRVLVLVVAAAGVTWAVALAASDGWDAVTRPLTTQYEYEPFAATIDSPRDFVRTFTDRIDGYPTHVRGHPPIATLVPWALDRLGLGGAGWLAALCICGWGAATGAVMVAVRAVGDELVARRVAPLLAVLPGAVWAATSMDALFAGVAALGVAAMVVAVVSRRDGVAAAGGLVFGVALLLSYGVAPLALLPGAVGATRRAWRPLAVAAGATVLVLLAAAGLGFSWIDGLLATRAQYWQGVARHRPAAYFALAGNPAALALTVGPAVAAALAMAFVPPAGRWRNHVLPLVALAAVVAVDVTLLSKGEVERIWLPFVPWLALAVAALRPWRGWIAAQVALGLVLQAGLVSPW